MRQDSRNSKRTHTGTSGSAVKPVIDRPNAARDPVKSRGSLAATDQPRGSTRKNLAPDKFRVFDSGASLSERQNKKVGGARARNQPGNNWLSSAANKADTRIPVPARAADKEVALKGPTSSLKNCYLSGARRAASETPFQIAPPEKSGEKSLTGGGTKKAPPERPIGNVDMKLGR